MYLMAGQILHELGRSEDAREWVKTGIDAAEKKGDGHALSELEGLLAQVGGP
jgi:hypothetical protein